MAHYFSYIQLYCGIVDGEFVSNMEIVNVK
jgi:hypothetical protein